MPFKRNTAGNTEGVWLMLTLNDIINASFRKSSFSGYRPEDVDAFLDLVKESYEQLIKKNIEQKDTITSLKAENEQMVKKIEVLAERVETYRSEEDEIKNALVSAQKLSDASIREARHKAEIIVKDANIKADRIVNGAKSQIGQYERELEELKKSVSDFRANLLKMYKQHLTLIDAIPSQKAAEPKPAPPAEKKKPAEPAPKKEAAEAPKKEESKKEEPKKEEPQKEAPKPEPPKPAPVEEKTPAPEPKPVKEEAPIVMDDEDSFTLDVTGFEPPAEDTLPSRDIRYASLKFGDDYDISTDPDSPDNL